MGNLAPMPGVFPDYKAPIVRNGADGRELALARWGIHPKAMPVILTTPAEVEIWMTAPVDEALKLQRPLPDGSLRIVARGVKEDSVQTVV